MPSIKPLVRAALPATALLALSCGRPDFNTDLETEGPPEVTLVAVASEAAGVELATFCYDGPLRNIIYCEDGVAPDMVADAPPIGFTVRIAFDELLDPSIETLYDEDGNPTTNIDDAVTGSIVDADPVSVECGDGDLAYTGYYDPSGNAYTDPPGPALVVSPTDPVASGAACTVTVNGGVEDKDGNAVPSAQVGPYEFAVAALSVAGSDPEDGADGIDPAVTAIVQFNNHIDPASLTGKVTMADDGGTDVPVTLGVVADDDTQVQIMPDAALAENTTYTITVAADIADVKGGTFDPEGGTYTITFTTGMTVVPDAGM